MKLCKDLFHIATVLIAIVAFSQCKKNINTVPEELKLEVAKGETADPFFVDVLTAEKVAAAINLNSLAANLKVESKRKKRLTNKKSFKDINGIDALHIFNYETEGQKSFVIV